MQHGVSGDCEGQGERCFSFAYAVGDRIELTLWGLRSMTRSLGQSVHCAVPFFASLVWDYDRTYTFYMIRTRNTIAWSGIATYTISSYREHTP